MDDFEIEIKNEFLNEASDLLENAESAFLRLEAESGDQNLIDEIFRLAHNLKGSSKAVGFDQLSELTHSAENLILKIKEKTLTVDKSVVSVLLDFNDKVNEIVTELKSNLDATFEINELKEKLTAVAQQQNQESPLPVQPAQELEKPKANDPETSPIESNQKEQSETQEIETPEISEAALESLKQNGFDESVIAELRGLNHTNDAPSKQTPKELKQEAPQQAPQIKAQKNTSKSENDESIRVNLSRIDKINNIVGELVILQTVLSQRRFNFIHDDQTNKTIGMMGKLFKEVQELAMSLRMLPLKTTFQKMTRIVRDTAIALDKDVDLELHGVDTEVDKTVLEKLGDPLVHIIRNAVDHGIETKSERESVNKPKKGKVTLGAYHEGNNLVIEVKDDGKGIDPSSLKEKAIEKGVIRANENLNPTEILQLIFHPGFSTKEEVTEVSGRGVGMDVVKTNIESLGGEILLSSVKGVGSTFKIILPLTLAIVDGIIIRANENKYVLPLSQIFEITQVSDLSLKSFTGVSHLFELRGEVLPLFFLNHKIGEKVSKRESYTVLIVRGLSYTFGVAVDDIHNQQQIVIKPLGKDIRNKTGFAGSAILSDGKPSLILDLLELYKNDLEKSRGYQGFRDKLSAAA